MPNLGLNNAEKIQKPPPQEGFDPKSTEPEMQKMLDKCKKKAATGGCHGHKSSC